MVSIRNRVQTDGSVKFAVLFRERATRKQTSLTYASRVEAERMAAVIEANGGDLRSAQRVTAASKRKSPLVQDVVLEHISMLTAWWNAISTPPRVAATGMCGAAQRVSR